MADDGMWPPGGMERGQRARKMSSAGEPVVVGICTRPVDGKDLDVRYSQFTELPGELRCELGHQRSPSSFGSASLVP